MEHGQQEVQPRPTLGRTWSKFPEDISQRESFKELMVITKGWNSTRKFRPLEERATIEPDRASYDSFRLTRSRPTQILSGFTKFRHQQISGQESPFFKIPGSFQEKTRIQGQKQHISQPKAERFRSNDQEAVGLGERSTQGPQIVVNTSRISSPNNRNINPTQNEHSVFTPKSNLKSD
ncbi:hypothetical protein O181_008714 [Austropuccinia psidii MF-1]|uniref:Uncharacterized protein n=1 Tax=Austropuccinia psidii MF-1 TaxID=1389203 RepID=A0A9Q3GJ47_9BASI|nr:hypothetical protein [Austropuccinia psidii MF-1]